jgi:hypothetical protein
MDGQAGRFVHDEKIRILVKRLEQEIRGGMGAFSRYAEVGGGLRWDPDLIPALHPIARSATAAADPDLSRPDQPVDVTFGD